MGLRDARRAQRRGLITAVTLDGVAIAIEEGREAVFPASIGLWRNVRHRASIFHLPAESVAVVTLVAMQNVARRKPRQKFRARGAIGYLAAGEHEGERATLGIGQRMDFGRAPAARTTDGLIFLPPLPPLAERCAFTAEESMRTCAGGPPACASA
ncbi:MAG: hypothetical protein FD139_3656 [Methylocystaceae bacterium]|nr:MAG: hypothetical protein FD139_3656 [Methylocystaceae bacterium]